MKELLNIPRRNVRGKKTRNPGYQPGNHWVICDVCACSVRANDSKYRWDGAVVCQDDWEPRHPQDFVRARQDRIVPQGPIRPESSEGVDGGCAFVDNAFSEPLENEQTAFVFTPPGDNLLNDNDNYGRNVHLTDDYAIVLEPGWDIVEEDNLDEGRINIYSRTTGELDTTLYGYELYPGNVTSYIGVDGDIIHDDNYLYIGVPLVPGSTYKSSGAVLVLNIGTWTTAAIIQNPFTYYADGDDVRYFGWFLNQDNDYLYVLDKGNANHEPNYIFKISKSGWTVSGSLDLSIYGNEVENSWGYVIDAIGYTLPFAVTSSHLYIPIPNSITDSNVPDDRTYIYKGAIMKLDKSSFLVDGVFVNPLAINYIHPTKGPSALTRHNWSNDPNRSSATETGRLVLVGNGDELEGQPLERSISVIDCNTETLVFLGVESSVEENVIDYEYPSGEITSRWTDYIDYVVLDSTAGLTSTLWTPDYFLASFPDNSEDGISTTGYVDVYLTVDSSFVGRYRNPDYNTGSIDSYDYFGYAMSYSDNGILIGAWSEDSPEGLQQDGAAYLLDLRNYIPITGND